uniref:Uncharacterized protein n=1 Tax=Rhizophora mucronata TaxID=61149 RepID=A0A2P2NPE9_RHIMU
MLLSQGASINYGATAFEVINRRRHQNWSGQSRLLDTVALHNQIKVVSSPVSRQLFTLRP